MSYKKVLLVLPFVGSLRGWISSRFGEAFRDETLRRGESWDVLVGGDAEEILQILEEADGMVVFSLGDEGKEGVVLGYARAKRVPVVGVALGDGALSWLETWGIPVVVLEDLEGPGIWGTVARQVFEKFSPGVVPPVYPGLVRHGLDIRPPEGYGEICQVFGNIEEYIREDGTLSPAWEDEILALAPLPFSIPLSWDPAKRATRLRCHKLLVPVFEALFQEIVDRGMRPLVRTYGGCYCFRRMRGGSRLSTHSWGIAIDLNPDTNPLGSQGDMAPELVELFEEFGFTWGGRFSRPDPMHFQFCSGY